MNSPNANSRNSKNSGEQQGPSPKRAANWVIVLLLILVVGYMGLDMLGGADKPPLQVAESDSTVTDSTVSDSTHSDSTALSDSSSSKKAEAGSPGKAPGGPATSDASTTSEASVSDTDEGPRRRQNTGQNTGPGTSDGSSTEPTGPGDGATTQEIAHPEAAASTDEKIRKTVEKLDEILKEEITQNSEAARDALTMVREGPSAVREKLSIAIGSDSRRINRFDDLIIRYCRLYGVDPLLAKAIAKQESDMNSKARNPRSTAAGLTQVVADTYRLVHPEEENLSDAEVEQRLMDPNVAVETGVRYLAKVRGATNGAPRQMAFFYYLGHKAPEQLVNGGLTPYLRNYIGRANQYAQQVMNYYKRWKNRLEYSVPEWAREG